MRRVAVLRFLRRIPKASIRPSEQIRRIFFSFPYHSVGDLILSLTLLDRIHDRWPDAEIDFAVGASMAPLVHEIPYVRRTYPLTRARSRQPWLAAYAEVRNQTQMFQREVSGTEYDLAIAPRWDSTDSFLGAYLAYLTGAPIRCGYSGACDGGSAEVDRLFTVAANGGANEHESLRYTRLLGRCGLEPEDAVKEYESQHTIRSLMVVQARNASGYKTTAVSPGDYLVVAPGATNGRRMWPTQRFCQVARALNRSFGLTILVIGSPAESELCQELASSIGDIAISMAGKTGPLRMLDLIADAKLFLGNDSGPAHIAGGLGIPTLVISPFPLSCDVDHPNSPRRFRPAGPFVEVLQPQAPIAPCFPVCQLNVSHCILQVTTEAVLAAAHSMMEHIRIQATSDLRLDDDGA